MTFVKTLALELIPALLAALVAGGGAYMAIKDDMTTVQVNQKIILEVIQDGKAEFREVRKEVYEQGVRLAVLEERLGK